MKSIFHLLRQYSMPFNGWPWLHYVGLALLPLVILTGIFYPRLAFGMAVWDFVILLAIPFMVTPKLLRTLLCNRRLALVPGFATKAILTALLFTLLLSTFLSFFGWLYAIPGIGLRNSAELFVVISVYVVVMQYAVTTASAMFAISILPGGCIVVIMFIMQRTTQHPFTDGQLLALSIGTLLGWAFAILRTRFDHRFRAEHVSVENYKMSGYQRVPTTWLLQGGNALADPDATLLLGYPATLATRLRVLVYFVFLGPTVATLFLSVMNFSANVSWHPTVLEMFMAISLFPTAFAAFQNLEWVTRLRLLWLRRPTLRSELWQFLEKQMTIHVLLLMVPCCVLLLCGLLFSQRPPTLLIHYPVLVLVFNVFYAYYLVCARSAAWPMCWGLIVAILGSACIFGCLWAAIAWDNNRPLFGLEALVIVGGIKFRMLARHKLQSLDWLVVRPFMTKHTM